MKLRKCIDLTPSMAPHIEKMCTDYRLNPKNALELAVAVGCQIVGLKDAESYFNKAAAKFDLPSIRKVKKGDENERKEVRDE
jgi:hypothetical protein